MLSIEKRRMKHALAVLTCFVLAVFIRCSKTLEANGQISQGEKEMCFDLTLPISAFVSILRDLPRY